jgi:thioredoxin reductase (NADPH)
MKVLLFARLSSGTTEVLILKQSDRMTENSYQILIVGGGPIGLACALEAKKANLTYVVIEKGCLVNSLFNYPLYMTFFSTSERLEIGGVPFVCNNPKPNRPEALEYYRRIAFSAHLNIRLQEEVLRIDPMDGRYTVSTSKANYLVSQVIIATGFYDIPVLLNVPGENQPKVRHYYRDPHFYAMQRVLVVGASNSAVDAALETWRKGAEVTMAIQGETIGPRVKYWVKPDIENRIKEGSIKAYFLSTVSMITEDEVELQTPDGPVRLKNDYVLAMTGYKPDFTLLRNCGIRLSEDETLEPVYNPDTMETNMKNIFLAGVICGGMNTHVWFIENSREHAGKIVQHIAQAG